MNPRALLYVLVIPYLQLASCIDTFAEKLTVNAVSQKHVLVSLTFKQTHDLQDKHAFTFPLAIKYLAASTPLADLQLHLTRGRWDYEAWGAPHVEVHPPGAAVSVVWQSPSLHTSSWTRVMHRLSGLMCASLNLAMNPEAAPSQHIPMTDTNTGMGYDIARCDIARWQHTAWLPREAVCTENITPWLKLLPCKGAAGLAGLLSNRSTVFGADYHSMSLHLSVKEGAKASGQKLLLTQTFSLVLRSSCPATHTCTLATILGVSNPPTACSAAMQDIELIRFQPHAPVLPSAQSQTAFEHGHNIDSNSRPDPPFALLPSLVAEQVRPEQAWALQVSGTSGGPASPPPALLHSSLSGMGLYAATLQLVIQLTHASGLAAADAWPSEYQQLWQSEQPGSSVIHPTMGVVCIQQWVPWVLRVWLHTQHISITSEDKRENGSHLVFWQSITAAVDRINPLLLTTCLYVPDHATHITLRWRASRAFLTLDEHPPDAHRGWDIPPAHLLYVQHASHAQPAAQNCQDKQQDVADGGIAVAMRRVLGPSLLIQLATADTAMPYNVICLTSTVMAVFVGATFNVLMQRTNDLTKTKGLGV